MGVAKGGPRRAESSVLAPEIDSAWQVKKKKKGSGVRRYCCQTSVGVLD